MKKKFQKGLIKSTQSTNSLIITNGRNKLVGEAVEENYEKIDVMGIIPSHVVAYRNILENNKNSKQVNKLII
jgi:hypothetical protein